ncbi:hypothetical protein QW131_04850 [Roseibium salinum]|nr:hypothetical protein [Roseibium salinum]
MRATGASQIQRYRFGVIPQILPVFVSQVLYYLESNTRSATVIGALGGQGGHRSDARGNDEDVA